MNNLNSVGDLRTKRSRIRVVHVSSAHRWTDNRVHLREAQSLAKAGYDTALVAVRHGMTIPETGVRIVQIAPRPRVRRMLAGSVNAVWETLRMRPHLAHLHDPELVWAIPVFKLLGIKTIYDAHEDLPSQVEDKHYLNQRAIGIARFLARFTVWMSKASSHVIAATEKIADRYETARVTVVHNYPRLRDSENLLQPCEARDKRLAYIGALGEARGSQVMMQAFAHSNFPRDWTVEFAGSTAPASLLDQLRLEPGWKVVNYRGVVSPDDARDLLQKCRVGLIVFQANKAHLEALPTKLFEYMAAGIPVIASDFPLWRSIIERFDCGLLVDQTSASSVAAAVSVYDRNPELLAAHGKAARSAAMKELNWESEGSKLIDLYDNLFGHHEI